MQQRPPSLLGAAGVQAADALIVLAASVLAGIDTVSGQSYQRGSGIALTLIGLATAAALAWVAVGLSQGRRWSRTPAALTQLFVGIVGIYLVQGHRYEWGIPSLVLAAAGLALLLMPASLRALAGPESGNEAGPGSTPGPRRRPGPGRCRPKRSQPRPGQPRRRRAKRRRPSQGPQPSRARQASAPPAASSPARRRPAAGGSSPSRATNPAPAADEVRAGAGKWGFRGLGPPG